MTHTARTITAVDFCGPVEGQLVAMVPGAMRPARPFDGLTERVRATWTAGDFGRIAVGFAEGAAAFVARHCEDPGPRVLDVACGTGNLAIPAARRGARVTGLDIAPNLLVAARAAAEEAGVPARFDEGDAEDLPYAAGSFDIVLSMFGVMFAPHPDVAMSEMFRVAAPGGRIALANWTPRGFIGSMLRAHTSRVPPPPGVPSVLDWGDEETLRRRLAPFTGGIRAVHMEPRTITLAYPLPPAGVVELFQQWYGPSVRTFAALDADGRASLSADLLGLWSAHNTAAPGATAVDAEYLDVRIDLV